MILHLDGAFRGGERAGEFSERAIARRLDQSPLMADEAGFDQFPLEPLDFGIGGFLGALHQRRVTDYVGGQDCRQSPLNPLLGHSTLSKVPAHKGRR
jgi:hypothetical protein